MRGGRPKREADFRRPSFWTPPLLDDPLHKFHVIFLMYFLIKAASLKQIKMSSKTMNTF